ncbi:MAG: septum formation initiator family protein [Alphaproteobacteria bacterium]|jgi:cell division protein FtsB|nr:septum formation initiator family protein [Alphaproteobacteria bacterium]MBP7729720.1 septum formation initiator family protein [Alphaproteobacteria bacterium]
MHFNIRNFQRLSQKALAPSVGLAVMGYFIYHSIQGDRGMLAWLQLQERLLHVESQLKEIIQERQFLEEKVRDLRPENINRDLLDQQVRLQLGYTHPDEVVILKLDNPVAD